jgi:hypothetical protein
MSHFLKQCADGNFHAEFLADFADEALLKRLARLAFAAGKFPKPAKMRLRAPLRNQKFFLAENERRRNFNLFHLLIFTKRTAVCHPLGGRVGLHFIHPSNHL